MMCAVEQKVSFDLTDKYGNSDSLIVEPIYSI